MKTSVRLRATLRTRLVLLVLAAGLPLVAFAAFTAFRWLDETRAETRARALVAARLAADRITTTTSNVERFLAVLAQVEIVQSGSPEQRDRLLAALASRNRLYHALFFLDPTGREQGRSWLDPTLPRLDAAHRAYFQEALQRRAFTVSAIPVVGMVSGETVVPMLAPVRSSEGRLLGFVGASIAAFQLQAAWSGLDLPPGHVVTLVARETGTIITRSSEPERYVLQPLALHSRLAGASEGTFEAAVGAGEEQLVAFANVPETPWQVLVMVPVSIAFARWQESFRQVLTLLALALAGTLTAALIFSQQITRPIAALRQATADLRARAFLPVSVASGDELEALANDFNAMAAELVAYHATLEERVASATEAARQAAQAARAEAEVARALVEAARVVGSSLELDEVLDRLLDVALARLEASRCLIWLFDPAAHGYRIYRLAGPAVPAAELLAGLVLQPDRSALLQRLAADRTVLPIENVGASGLLPTELAERLGLKSLLVLPIVIRDELAGLIFAAYTTEPYRFSDRTLALGSGLAAQAALAIANARLYADLQATKARLEAMLAHAPIGIIFYDAEGRLVYANPTFRREVLAITDEQLAARPTIEDLIALSRQQERWTGDPQTTERGLAEIKRSADRVGVLELRLTNPDAWFVRIAAPVFAGERRLGTVVLHRNVTRERRAIEERERFLTLVSHEIRTPLASVRGYAQFLQGLVRAGQTPERDRLVAIARTIDEQAGRIERLVDDLLDAAQLESGRLKLALCRFDLASEVERLVAALEPLLPWHPLHLDRPAEPLPIEGDPDRIAQAISNLVTNAAFYSPPGAPVEIALRRLDGQVEVAVRDHGPGIPPAEQPRLFDPFYRGEQGATRRAGLGLGLYVASELVQRHGGSISVESELGQGSTFRIRLPLAADPPRSSESA